MSRSRSRSRSASRGRSASPARREGSPNRKRPSPGPSPPRGGGAQANLYVTGLAARTSDEDLDKHFRGEGKIKHAKVCRDPRSHESRGFGFVQFEDARDADAAVKYLDRSVLCGRVIHVEKARRERPRTPTPGAYRGVRMLRDLGPGGGDRYGDRDGGGRDRYHDRDRERDRHRRSPPPSRRRSPSPYRRRRSP